MSSHLRSILQAPKERQRVRLSGTVGAATSGKSPWNAHAPFGHYAEIWSSSGCAWFRWAPVGTPPFTHTLCAADMGDATSPRLVLDDRGTITVSLASGGAVYLTHSYDDGLTWETPSMAFASGTFPTIAVGADGSLLLGARVGGLLQLQRRAPGDTAWSAAFTAKDAAAADLALAADTFHFSAAPEGPGRWIMHCRLSGATDTTTLYSGDDGATWGAF
jgi:hypothetical protein